MQVQFRRVRVKSDEEEELDTESDEEYLQIINIYGNLCLLLNFVYK
jgi:hypothetical protein